MKLNNLEALGNQFTVHIPPDEDRFIGRECPVPDCEGYFKIELGTGLKGQNLPCHCPYCGHTAEQGKFYTKAQLEYLKSVVFNKVTGALLKDLKTLEFNHPPRGDFGIGFSLKVTGQPHPIRHYREKTLETEVVCDHCTLRYAIYGVFAYCPDCGAHNSFQILLKNLELTTKQLELAKGIEMALAEHLIGDALENAVSAFDGFGRETCRVSIVALKNVSGNLQITFQNLEGARNKLKSVWNWDFAAGIDASEWEFACQCFQKRHLIAHKMGVVDEAYVRATGDTKSVVGRKIVVTAQEVELLTQILRKLGTFLCASLPGLPKGQQP